MRVREHVSLATLSTLRVGGKARIVIDIESEEDVPAALRLCRERGVPFVALGEGSNVLAPDEGYPGAILLMRIPGVASEDDGATTLLRVGAGVSWDAFVRDCAERGLWGLENLAGIPGTVGAAPVQNIGAYGAEARTTIERVRAYDAAAGEWREFDTADCEFSYRDSRFKREPNLIIARVDFRLANEGAPHVEYADLLAAKAEGKDLSTPAAIGATVRQVRSRKFPDLSQYGTAGSFFKNPIVSAAKYDELAERFRDEAAPFGGIPRYPVPGQVKIPLAFILDKFLGLRGYQLGPAFLFGNQPLVLVAGKGAHARDVDALARDIEERVMRATGIAIEREVRMLDAHQYK